jgi:hypothetical protein
VKLKGVLFVLVAAAAWPATGNAAPLHGVVVARSHGTLLVATPNGIVRSVRGSAAVGSRLVGARVVGRSSRARIHGVVVERLGSTIFLSSNRHLLAVHTRTTAGAPVPGSPVSGPQPGSVVDTTVGVQANGELDEENEDQVGQAGGTIQIQATITAVGAGTVTVSVNGQSLTVNLPNGLTLPSTVVGQTVTFTASLGGGDQGDDDQGDDDGGGGDD